MSEGKTSEVLFAFVDKLKALCELLAKPANHISMPSGHYVEKQVHVRPGHDMTDEMAQERIHLPRCTAYATILAEKGRAQRVWKGNMQTRPLYKETHNANRGAIDNPSVGSLKREAVEAAIRQRQEPWRQPPTQASPPEPPEEPPPPTSFSGQASWRKGCTRGMLRPPSAGGMRAEKPQMTASELRQALWLRSDGTACSPEHRQKSRAALADSWRCKEAAQDACAWSWGGRGARGDVSSHAAWVDMTRRLRGRHVPREAPWTP
jgi:hypothetical protein